MTRDNVLEGDTGASALARQLGRTVNPPAPLRIRVPAHVGLQLRGGRARRGSTARRPSVEAGPHLRRPGHLDRTRRASPGRQRNRRRGLPHRPIDDQWELYDLTADPIGSRQPLGRSGTARAAPASADAAQAGAGRRCPSEISRGPTRLVAHPSRSRVSFAGRSSGCGTGPMADRNVLGGALQPCGTDPLTGFYRDGCCSTGPEDIGRHTICAVVTAEFLAHQQLDRQRPVDADARTTASLACVPGDRWCVTAANWLRAPTTAAPARGAGLDSRSSFDVVPLEGTAGACRRRARRLRRPVTVSTA